MDFKIMPFVIYVIVVCQHGALSMAHAIPSEPCQASEPLMACQCIKSGRTIELQCTNTDADGFYRDMSKLHDRELTSIQIRDSDLSKIEGLPDEYIGITLETLQLDNVNIDAAQLPVLLRGMEAIKHILIDNNKKQLHLSKETFFSSNPIESLVLNSNGFTDDHIESDVFDNIKNTLKVLRLRNNRLTQVPKAIESLLNLEELDVQENAIITTSPIFISILSTLPQLKKLDVSTLDCQCDTFLSDPLITFIRQRNIQDMACTKPAKFASRNVLEIDHQKECGCEQLKLSVLAVIACFALSFILQ